MSKYVARNNSGYIYFIQPDGRPWVKIGWSKDPISRLTELQCGSPEPLSLLISFPGTIVREGQVRAMFSTEGTRGEWVPLTSDICQFVENWKGRPDECAVHVYQEIDYLPIRLRTEMARRSIAAELSIDLHEWLVARPELLPFGMLILGEAAVHQLRAAGTFEDADAVTDAADLIIQTVVPYSRAGRAA